jgi:hypothetical protein
MPGRARLNRAKSGPNTLRALPRSSDRTCLRQSSPSKREFLRFGLETFGKFSLELPFFGDPKLNGSVENARILQGFWALGAHSHRLSD